MHPDSQPLPANHPTAIDDARLRDIVRSLAITTALLIDHYNAAVDPLDHQPSLWTNRETRDAIRTATEALAGLRRDGFYGLTNWGLNRARDHQGITGRALDTMTRLVCHLEDRMEP